MNSVMILVFRLYEGQFPTWFRFGIEESSTRGLIDTCMHKKSTFSANLPDKMETNIRRNVDRLIHLPKIGNLGKEI